MLVVSLVALSLGVPWPTSADSAPLAARLDPPEGYARIPTSSTSFGAWLRALPVKPGRPPVRLFDGRPKANQRAQWLVLDVDVGARDLQQCADAVMRLFAEWQFARGHRDDICFRFTSGHRIPWSKWANGYRPRVRGAQVSLVRRATPQVDYRAFRRYLTSIFIYAGSASLSRDLATVGDPRTIKPGDVFIQGGFPGHAVIVVDVVENAAGERRFALAQSYMPAQEIHVLRNPNGTGPWYTVEATSAPLRTPEWTFAWTDLKRFGTSGCPPGE